MPLIKTDEPCLGMKKTLLSFILSLFSMLGFGQAVSIGDILCTDGSIVSRAAYPTSGKAAQGIVFYVDATDSHGWAVSLNNQSSSIKWCSEGFYGYDIPNLPNSANARAVMHDLDGYGNTGAIRGHGNSSQFPAAWAVDYDNGWYLPSGGQLRYLYSYMPEINASLQVVGGSLFPFNENHYWWSSSEFSEYHAYDMNTGGSIGDYVKDNHVNYPPNGIAVRQIRDFTIANPVHPTYHVGDLITNDDGSQGILFYVNPDQTEGWMVALNDASTSIAWGNGDIPGLDNQACSAPYGSLLNETDGFANTTTIRNNQTGMNTAANVVDYEHGWYLPTAGQLSKLFGALAFIEDPLQAHGSTLANAEYWSSTEADGSNAFTLSCNPSANVRAGHFVRRDKSSNYRVREVRNFVIPCETTTIGIQASDCSSYSFNGVTYTESGNYEQLVESPDGCDTLYHIEVSIGGTITHEWSQQACNHFVWNGINYTEAGNYVQEFVTEAGCDSIVTLHLSFVNELEAIPEIIGLTQVNVGTDLILGQYFYHIDSVPLATHYEWTLEGADWIMDTTGTYCSLLITSPGTAILRVKAWNDCGEKEQEIVIHAGFFDVDEHQSIRVALYPNPAKDKVVIEAEDIQSIKVYDIWGQLLKAIDGANISKVEISLQDLATAIYTVEVLTKQGKAIKKLSVVK